MSVEKPEKCQICGECDFEQDTDTFDTWFSSAQWPFATLMSCSNSKLKIQSSKLRNSNEIIGQSNNEFFSYFYPTSVMETGYDILPWWVCPDVDGWALCYWKVPSKQSFLHGIGPR